MEPKIEIEKKGDVLIVEKSNDSTILKGSHIFCGCCGKTIGSLKENITFPFETKDLFPKINNLSLEAGPFTGFMHKKCGHTMFSFNRSLNFVPLEVYEGSKCLRCDS